MARPLKTEEAECKNCRTTFSKNCHNRKNIFCGKNCASSYRKGEVAWNKGLFTRSSRLKCGYCPSNFVSSLRSSTKKYGKFCSTSCAHNHRAQTASVYLECATCGLKFRTTIGHIKKGKKFCSDFCFRTNPARLEWQRKRMTGQGSPSWKGGVTVRTRGVRRSSEYQRARKMALKRDQNSCVLCSKKEGRMDVDHIKPMSKFPELACSLTNLRTLCFGCHKSTDSYGVNNKRL